MNILTNIHSSKFYDPNRIAIFARGYYQQDTLSPNLLYLIIKEQMINIEKLPDSLIYFKINSAFMTLIVSLSKYLLYVHIGECTVRNYNMLTPIWFKVGWNCILNMNDKIFKYTKFIDFIDSCYLVVANKVSGNDCGYLRFLNKFNLDKTDIFWYMTNLQTALLRIDNWTRCIYTRNKITLIPPIDEYDIYH